MFNNNNLTSINAFLFALSGLVRQENNKFIKIIDDKKRNRTNFNRQQLELLEKTFESNHYPNILIRNQLAKRLNIDAIKIKIWFQNRRAKWRKFDNTKKRPGRPSHYSQLLTCSGEPLTKDEIERKNKKRKKNELSYGIDKLLDF